PPPPLPDGCQGCPISWDVPGGSFLETFPVGRFSDGHGALPFTLEMPTFDNPKGRAKTCQQQLATTDPCSECAAIHKEVDRLRPMAVSAAPHTRYQLLSMLQLGSLARSLRAQINDLKLNSLNNTRRIGNTLARLDTFNVLLMALAKHDVPRVHQLISAARRHGDSLHTILNRVGEAIKTVYRPRGYAKEDLEMANLIYRL
ncbi:hypothetical protein CONPUDRAFT_21885, partial [Coniophora puteana RWD-64-598 SS2]